ncbi:MAG: hypothetical protein L3J02_04470 [Henriciella sp.]|nr:hypothetical protein [Henriciella sp.]
MKTTFAAIAAFALLPVATAAEVNVSYSEDFAEELADNYGDREGPVLAREITEDLDRAFAKAGIDPARVDVTIIDAKPNRPTFGQLRHTPSLDMHLSRSIGGMKLQATAYDSDGNLIGSKEYGWFENDIRQVIGATTWTDAKRASDRFARKFAKDLAS